MTRHGASIAAAAAATLAACAATAWPAVAPREHRAAPALVIDARLGRDGRELVDPALRDAGVTLRLPRSAREARVDVRYLVASGRRVIVVGPQSSAAAVPGVRRAPGVAAALAALSRAAR
jgi:ABC-type sugar transport system substrate-binding protein